MDSQRDIASELEHAARAGQASAVRVLLEELRDAGVDIADEACKPATFAMKEAASHGHVEVVRTFMDARVNGAGAFLAAATGGHVDSVSLLLPYGQDPGPCGNDLAGLALMLSITHGKLEVARLLCGAFKAWQHPFKEMALVLAEGNADAARLLLEHGADVADSNARYALSVAVHRGWKEVERVLRDAGIVDDPTVVVHDPCPVKGAAIKEEVACLMRRFLHW